MDLFDGGTSLERIGTTTSRKGEADSEVTFSIFRFMMISHESTIGNIRGMRWWLLFCGGECGGALYMWWRH